MPRAELDEAEIRKEEIVEFLLFCRTVFKPGEYGVALFNFHVVSAIMFPFQRVCFYCHLISLRSLVYTCIFSREDYSWS